MADVLLIDIDSKIPNLALMKLSAWHKRQGDQVERGEASMSYFGGCGKDWPDIVYASSVFTRSQKERAKVKAVYPDAITGGTGYDLTTELPYGAEMSTPDYSIYPTDTSMGFTTRGCLRKCQFCFVPKKEGSIKIRQGWQVFHNPKFKKIMLLDNNLLAAPKSWYEHQLRTLADADIEVTITQGIDARLLNKESAALLSKLKLHGGRLHLAFDHPRDEKAVRRAVKLFAAVGFKAYRLRFFILVGYNTTPEEDHARVHILEKLRADKFIMPHENADGDRREFARFINGAHGKIENWHKWVSGRKGRVGFDLE